MRLMTKTTGRGQAGIAARMSAWIGRRQREPGGRGISAVGAAARADQRAVHALGERRCDGG